MSGPTHDHPAGNPAGDSAGDPAGDPADEKFARRAVRLADPLRHTTVRPLDTTAAELRARADARAQTRARKAKRRRWLARTGAAAANAMAIAAGVLLVNTAHAAPAPLPMDRADPPPSAARWLRETATRLIAATGTTSSSSASALGAESSPRGLLIHLQRWSMDTTSRAREIVAFDERHRWTPGGPLRSEITRLPPQPPGLREAGFLDGGPPASPQPPDVTEYPPGGYSTVIGTPSADPATLAAQLAEHEPPGNGPQALVRAVAAVHEFHRLGPAQKAAMLGVLSQVDGLAFRGVTRDRAGRSGVALTIDSGGPDSGRVRDVLVVDGEANLLSHEQIALTPPPGLPDLPRYTVTCYVLFL